MKEKIKHGKSYYTSTLWILIIRSVLGLVLFGASFVIYIIFKCLLTYVFKVEQAIGDMVSLIVSMFFFAVPFIPQIKYFYVKSFNIIQQMNFGLSIKICCHLFVSFAINHAFPLREIYIINVQPYQFAYSNSC